MTTIGITILQVNDKWVGLPEGFPVPAVGDRILHNDQSYYIVTARYFDITKTPDADYIGIRILTDPCSPV